MISSSCSAHFLRAADTIDECLPLAVLFQLRDIKSLLALALGSSYRLNAQVEFANNEPVICPTVFTTQSLCHSDILSILPPHYDISNEMPVF